MPTVSNITPAAASAITAQTVVGFDVTDADAFRRIIIVADFTSIGLREVIHNGDSFSPNYPSTLGNAKTAISGGFRFTFLRNGGWPVSPTITPYAIDVTGAENP